MSLRHKSSSYISINSHQYFNRQYFPRKLKSRFCHQEIRYSNQNKMFMPPSSPCAGGANAADRYLRTPLPATGLAETGSKLPAASPPTIPPDRSCPLPILSPVHHAPSTSAYRASSSTPYEHPQGWLFSNTTSSQNWGGSHVSRAKKGSSVNAKINGELRSTVRKAYSSMGMPKGKDDSLLAEEIGKT